MHSIEGNGTTWRAAKAQRLFSGLRADGSEVPLEASIFYSVADGRPTFTSILRDITRRLELEREVLGIAERERERIGGTAVICIVKDAQRSKATPRSP